MTMPGTMLARATNTVSLTKRPPTPPRESSGKLEDNTVPGGIAHRPLLDTPEESPSSSAEYFKGSSERRRKKVGFSGWTQYHRPAGSKGSESDEARRRLPPSRECNPTKSILKSSADRSTPQSSDEPYFSSQASLPAMLRSAALHLAGESRASRLDAYTSLLGCLSAYEGVPDAQNLSEKLVDITGFMRRDVDAKLEDGNWDSQLAAQVLKLTTVLLYTQGVEQRLPEDFCSFIFEKSLAGLEDPLTPKILVLHYMHLVEKQKFPPKVLTTDRQERLLSALSSITTRAKSNRIICHRLNIYLRLVTQARSLMINRPDQWMDHLVFGLISSVKDIRARAIAFGIEAGVSLGNAKSVTQACTNLCNRSPPGGEKFIDIFSTRLTEMLSSKEEGQHVPQIWSVIVLFIRSQPQQLEQWVHLKSLLAIIQNCLNSHDIQVKFQAYLAWNRFIFAINLEPSTSTSLAKALKQPIAAQFGRKHEDRDKPTRLAKPVIRSSFCTLLYYALRPNAPHTQLDLYWDLYVADVLPKYLSSGEIDQIYGCEILEALLYNDKQPKVWNNNRANLNNPMKPEELTPIDSKWIRTNVAKVLKTFEAVMNSTNWSPNPKLEFAFMAAWNNFMLALGNAGSKEVKVSMDAMVAIACLLNWFKRILECTGLDQDSIARRLDLFRNLLDNALARIGHIPFNEKRISLDTRNMYEACGETPSSRASSKSTSSDSAASYLLNLLLTDKSQLAVAACEDALTMIVRIHLRKASSRQARLRGLRELTYHIADVMMEDRVSSTFSFWNVIASELILAIDIPKSSENHSHSPEYPGHEIRDAVKVLELGCRLQSESILPMWKNLHQRLLEKVRSEVSDAAVIIVIQEPLSQAVTVELTSMANGAILKMGLCVLMGFQPPIDAKILGRASSQLWGVPSPAFEAKSYRANARLYQMAKSLLEVLYVNCEATEVSVSYLKAVEIMVHACEPVDQRFLLESIQGGLALWVEDASGIMGESTVQFKQVERLGDQAMEFLALRTTLDTKTLTDFEVLISSFFNSRHKRLLNRAIAWWNENLGTRATLNYPEILQRALSRVNEIAGISLPNFPEVDHEATSSPLRFIESQESEDLANEMTPQKTSNFRSTSAQLHAITPSPASIGSSKSLRSDRRESKSTPKAKLRHDDSQIQFAAIESSPMPAGDSESQALTNRQKEVHERQQVEAAMFPEMRSSPRVVVRADDYRLPKLAFPKSAAADRLNVEEDHSPTLPPDTIMKDFLGSSPTPSSSRQRSDEPFSDDGPPSSPPVTSSRLRVDQLLTSQHNSSSASDNLPVDFERGDSLALGNESPPLPPMNNGGTRNCMRDLERRGESLQIQQPLMESHVTSDLDIFLDAPGEALRNPAEGDHQKGDAAKGGLLVESSKSLDLPAKALVSSVDDIELPDTEGSMNSSQRENQSIISLEDEQVKAQLLSEIASASSQKSRKAAKHGAEGKASTGKRKRSSIEGSNKKRATKSRIGFQSQTQRSRRSSSQSVVDCVLIESSSAANNADRTWIRVKRERSASPQSLDAFEAELDSTSAIADEQTNDQLASPRESISEPEQQQPGRLRKRSETIVDPSLRRVTRKISHLNQDDPSSTATAGSRYTYTAEPIVSTSTNNNNHTEAPQPSSTKSASLVSASASALQQPTDHPDQTTGSKAEHLLHHFQNMLSEIRQVMLAPEEERAMVGVLFDSVQQVHEAGRRHAANLATGRGQGNA